MSENQEPPDFGPEDWGDENQDQKGKDIFSLESETGDNLGESWEAENDVVPGVNQKPPIDVDFSLEKKMSFAGNILIVASAIFVIALAFYYFESPTDPSITSRGEEIFKWTAETVKVIVLLILGSFFNSSNK